MRNHRLAIVVSFLLLLANAGPLLAQAACPSANIADVLKDPRVQEALDNAWRDSHEGQPDEHEEGGWIYQCQMPNGDGTFRYYTDVRPWPPGDIDGASPAYPPRVDANCRLVASYHTHPGGGAAVNPGHDGYNNWEASPQDRLSSANDGLPGIIRYGSGTDTPDFTYGYNGMTEPRDPSWHCPGGGVSSGWGFGDTHVKTLDGYTYDFQAIGNFIYLTAARGDFDIHVQQQPYKELRHASMNTALAVRDGSDHLEWSVDRPDVLLNGVPRPLVEGGEVKLRSRGILRLTREGFLLLSSVGDRLTVVVSTLMVDFYVRPAAHRRGQVRGLLGNFDGNRDNDFVTSDGRVVPFVFSDAMDAAHPLYAVFGDSWRVPSTGGLVTRAMTSLGDVRAFPERAPDVSEAALAAARERCAASGISDAVIRDDCAFDVVATGDDAFTASAARAGREAERIARTVGRSIALNSDATGALNGREAEDVFSIRLAPGTYVFDAAGSTRTSWWITGPDGASVLDAQQSLRMGASPVRVTVASEGAYRIAVRVSFEMLDGAYRFRVRPAAAP